jgi:hypothetical protein
MARMDDEARRTWTGVFLILGVTVLAGGALRWFVWYLDDHPDDSGLPEVLWVLGFLGLAFVLAAVHLGWPRSPQGSAARTREDWTLPGGSS